MSKTNDTETRELEAKRAELLDSELGKVSGGGLFGLPIITVQTQTNIPVPIAVA